MTDSRVLLSSDVIHLKTRQGPQASQYTRVWRATIDTNPNYDVLLHPTWQFEQDGTERIGLTYFVAPRDARHHAVGALIDVLCQRLPTVGPFKLDALVYERLWLGEYTGRAYRVDDGVEVRSSHGVGDNEYTETCFVDWSYLHAAVKTLRAARAALAEAGEDSLPDPPYEIVLRSSNDDDAPLSEVRVVAAAHLGLEYFFQSLLALTPEELDTVLPLSPDSVVDLSGIHAFSYDRWFAISAWDDNGQALALVFLRLSTLNRMIGEVLGARARLNHSEP